MNMLEALTIVRNCSLRSAQMQTKQGKAALKVIDKKLQSLMRKKAWRDGAGAMPIHMADPNFTYPTPDTAPSRAEELAFELGGIHYTQHKPRTPNPFSALDEHLALMWDAGWHDASQPDARADGGKEPRS